MKKRLFVSLLALIIISLASFSTLANNNGRKNILNIYQIDDKYGAGIKIPLKKREKIYWGTNIEYHEDKGTLFELNSTYRIPEVAFFNFYGGGGLEIFTQDRKTDLFFLLGKEIAFLFNEVKYSIIDNKVNYRSGFRFRF